MSTKFKVPFDKKGNQQTFHQSWNTEEQEPYEFEAELTYVGFERGRSALNIVWQDTCTGIQYRSGMALLDDKLGNCSVEGNTIHGKFGFKKAGTSVLLKEIV